MSYIAVNLTDAKKEIHRIDLKTPIYGKNGASQKGEYINTDTKEPVLSFTLKHRGLYDWECLWVGENLQHIDKDGGFEGNDIEEVWQTVVTASPTVWLVRGILYAKKENLVYLPGEFFNLQPNNIIHHYHAVYSFRHQ